MKRKLTEVLEQFCPKNVYLQGTLSDEEYPEAFITFWTNYTDDITFYNDNVFAVEWDFTVIYYSSDPLQLESEPPKIRNALKQAGFIPQGKGNDIPSGRPSHTGWAMDYVYKEISKEI